MSFWRHFSKVLFFISLGLCGIGVIIASIIGFITNGLLGLAILFGGGFAVLVFHTFFGMFIEMTYNIADIRGMTVHGTLNVSYDAKPQDIKSTYNKLAAIADDSDDDEFWTCKSCGTQNDKLASTCKGCGKYK